MNTRLKNSQLPLLTAVLAMALLVAATGGGPEPASAAAGEPGTVHDATEAERGSLRRDLRPQLAMPYFSYSRVLPRRVEI